MSYVTSLIMLTDAQHGGYAVPAVNIENMEMAMAAVKAATELKSPIILQTTPSTLKYGELNIYRAISEAVANKAAVPVVLHLDHGDSEELAVKAVNAGYSSVMIDGSKLPFDKNVQLTYRVVKMAHMAGIPVEAELGILAGKEDDLESDGGGYTDPDMAAEFEKLTGIDSFAVSIGTAHGIYKGEPRLDLERLDEIRKKTKKPLVLHGASGLSPEVIRECIARGICKVNFATELRIAYSDAVKDYISKDSTAFDPKKYSSAGRDAVYELIKKIIVICGSDNKC